MRTLVEGQVDRLGYDCVICIQSRNIVMGPMSHKRHTSCKHKLRKADFLEIDRLELGLTNFLRRSTIEGHFYQLLKLQEKIDSRAIESHKVRLNVAIVGAQHLSWIAVGRHARSVQREAPEEIRFVIGKESLLKRTNQFAGIVDQHDALASCVNLTQGFLEQSNVLECIVSKVFDFGVLKCPRFVICAGLDTLNTIKETTFTEIS